MTTPRRLAAVQRPDPQQRAIIYVRVSTKDQAERDGDPEGYSIPAQREACTRKALAMGAEVVAEFVDRGESARSADRPELQRMLSLLVTDPVDYVIVHKVDRLARNRMDDVTITASIQAAGAQLVSVTENIDETPSGLLLHGIMSSIAEFYSRNLANEVIKGSQQKVRAGGTNNPAPIGYLNVRKLIDGRELRTVELDPERAPLIRWAFEAYATGNWSLNRLAAELEARGLRQRATAKQPERLLETNKLHAVLRNPYYMGVVTWRGVEYPGKHEALVSPTVFAEVQAVLTAHRQSGERAYRHHHYLAGSLFCARCGYKLIYGLGRGRRGDQYGYFFCYGRHAKKVSCDLPYLPVAEVEKAVQGRWTVEIFPDGFIEALKAALLADLQVHEQLTQTERGRLEERAHTIRRERYKWADKAMSGSVPDDIAREKQEQLASQLGVVEAQLAALTAAHLTTQEHIVAACAMAEASGHAYKSAGEKTRREFNQAWWSQLVMDAEDDTRSPMVARAERTEVAEALVTARIQPLDEPSVLTQVLDHETQGRRSFRYGVLSRVRGSNFPTLVELLGHYSRWTKWANHLNHLQESTDSTRSADARTRSVAKRLSPAGLRRERAL